MSIKNKRKLAKTIRIITIPPVLVSALLVILYFFRNEMFRPLDLLMSIVFLAVIPTFAYPLQPIMPGFKGKGRDGQRKLAFVTSTLGYIGGYVFSAVTGASEGLKFIYASYLLSVFLLLIFNQIFKLKASGHACGVLGPLLFAVYFMGPVWLIPCMLAGAAVVWSSLQLTRHTPKELVLGGLCALCAFFVCMI